MGPGGGMGGCLGNTRCRKFADQNGGRTCDQRVWNWTAHAVIGDAGGWHPADDPCCKARGDRSSAMQWANMRVRDASGRKTQRGTLPYSTDHVFMMQHVLPCCKWDGPSAFDRPAKMSFAHTGKVGTTRATAGLHPAHFAEKQRVARAERCLLNRAQALWRSGFFGFAAA